MKKAYIYIFVALLVIYLILAFALPPDPQVMAKHGLTSLSVKLLNLTILIPISLIYLAALYGFIRVNDYAERVRSSTEGPYFRHISTGLMLLAFSLPVNSIFGSLAGYIRHAQPHLFSDISIVRQYIALAFAFAAVYFISKGAQGLYGTLKRPASSRQSTFSFLGPIVLACVFTWLIETQGHNNPGGEPYFLPGWAVIFTIAVPYVFVWCTGIWAALQIHKYQGAVKGRVYRRAIDYLAKGIAGIILVSILLQFVTTLSGLLNRLDLTPLLLVIYVLIALYAVGYGLVARGARKLKQLEEV